MKFRIDSSSSVSRPSKTLNLQDCKHATIIDIKNEDPVFPKIDIQKAYTASKNSETLFLISYRLKDHKNPDNQKIWTGNLDIFEPKKIELLSNFREYLLSWTDKKTTKHFSENRLGILENFLKANKIDLNSKKSSKISKSEFSEKLKMDFRSTEISQVFPIQINEKRRKIAEIITEQSSEEEFQLRKLKNESNNSNFNPGECLHQNVALFDLNEGIISMEHSQIIQNKGSLFSDDIETKNLLADLFFYAKKKFSVNEFMTTVEAIEVFMKMENVLKETVAQNCINNVF